MIPKENEADYDEVETLESEFDDNLGGEVPEVAACATPRGSQTFTFDNACSDVIAAAGVPTGKARRDYRRLCAAMEKISVLDAEEHHPPMVQRDSPDAVPAMPVESSKLSPPHRQKIGPHH